MFLWGKKDFKLVYLNAIYVSKQYYSSLFQYSVWQKQQLQGLWGNTGQATGLWKTVSTEKKNVFKLLK